MGMNVHDIQRLIEDAFVGVRRDNGCTLHQSQFSDTFGDFDISDAFLEYVRDHPRDKYRWQAAAEALASYWLTVAARPTDQILLRNGLA
jgi:hypothetical protein